MERDMLDGLMVICYYAIFFGAAGIISNAVMWLIERVPVLAPVKRFIDRHFPIEESGEE